jgi:hypothetical protein
MHRFAWPLRYAAKRASADVTVSLDGLWAPPGSYTVELSVAGQVSSQPLTVLPDPRIALPADAYARQLALARRVEALHERVVEARMAAEALHKALKEKGASEADLEVRVLTGPDFGEAFVAAPPGGVRTLRSLENALERLLTAVDGADAAPSPDAEAGLGGLERASETSLAAWNALRDRIRTRIPSIRGK